MSTGPGMGEEAIPGAPRPLGPVGLQTLLDLLVGVYQEFCSSPLSREKYVSGFLAWGEWLSYLNVCVHHVKCRGKHIHKRG